MVPRNSNPAKAKHDGPYVARNFEPAALGSSSTSHLLPEVGRRQNSVLAWRDAPNNSDP